MPRIRPHVRERHQGQGTGPLDQCATLAFLWRFDRNDLRAEYGRLVERTELPIEQRESGLDIEVACEDRLGVVRMEEDLVVLT